MVKVFRYRVKSLHGLLNRQRRAVNFVWNFCNDTQKFALKLTQQKISHVGTLVGIGGRDATAHAMLLNAEGTHWSFIVDRALARRLSGYLYGAPIRLIGEGTRERDERGDWSEKDLKATHFEVLKDVGWNEAIRSVRDLGGGWSEDAMETVAFLREVD